MGSNHNSGSGARGCLGKGSASSPVAPSIRAPSRYMPYTIIPSCGGCGGLSFKTWNTNTTSSIATLPQRWTKAWIVAANNPTGKKKAGSQKASGCPLSIHPRKKSTRLSRSSMKAMGVLSDGYEHFVHTSGSRPLISALETSVSSADMTTKPCRANPRCSIEVRTVPSSLLNRLVSWQSRLLIGVVCSGGQSSSSAGNLPQISSTMSRRGSAMLASAGEAPCC
mmetsp:Transcript_64007/g.143017  ORF Transcript_64007/g.143017 Transcript_64007/m.143017 type:complete len:223 (-) Transcript_64007:2347-3015(-)